LSGTPNATPIASPTKSSVPKSLTLHGKMIVSPITALYKCPRVINLGAGVGLSPPPSAGAAAAAGTNVSAKGKIILLEAGRKFNKTIKLASHKRMAAGRKKVAL